MDLKCHPHVILLQKRIEVSLSLMARFKGFSPRLPNDARRRSANSAEARLICAPNAKNIQLISKRLIGGVLYLADSIFLIVAQTQSSRCEEWGNAIKILRPPNVKRKLVCGFFLSLSLSYMVDLCSGNYCICCVGLRSGWIHIKTLHWIFLSVDFSFFARNFQISEIPSVRIREITISNRDRKRNFIAFWNDSSHVRR